MNGRQNGVVGGVPFTTQVPPVFTTSLSAHTQMPHSRASTTLDIYQQFVLESQQPLIRH